MDTHRGQRWGVSTLTGQGRGDALAAARCGSTSPQKRVLLVHRLNEQSSRQRLERKADTKATHTPSQSSGPHLGSRRDCQGPSNLPRPKPLPQTPRFNLRTCLSTSVGSLQEPGATGERWPRRQEGWSGAQTSSLPLAGCATSDQGGDRPQI